MNRTITLFTGQWADLSFEEICQKAQRFSYEGIEIACWGDHFDVEKATDAYCQNKLAILKKLNFPVSEIIFDAAFDSKNQ
tara:strand:- start:3702 stop:3941 length:240 start_codon:yes stop_codon:yes gene_type:complete